MVDFVNLLGLVLSFAMTVSFKERQPEEMQARVTLEGELNRLLADRDGSLYYLGRIFALATRVGGGHWWLSEGSVVVEFNGIGPNKGRVVINENGFIVKGQDGGRITVESKLKTPLEEVPDGILLLQSQGGAKLYLGISRQIDSASGEEVGCVVVEREILP